MLLTALPAELIIPRPVVTEPVTFMLPEQAVFVSRQQKPPFYTDKALYKRKIF